MYVDERESRFRSEIIEFLEEKGYTIEKTEPRSRQEIIDQNLPIKVDLDNRTYAMMGNTTCAAAACSGRALSTRAEFYEDFKKAQNLKIYSELSLAKTNDRS